MKKRARKIKKEIRKMYTERRTECYPENFFSEDLTAMTIDLVTPCSNRRLLLFIGRSLSMQQLCHNSNPQIAV